MINWDRVAEEASKPRRPPITLASVCIAVGTLLLISGLLVLIGCGINLWFGAARWSALVLMFDVPICASGLILVMLGRMERSRL